MGETVSAVVVTYNAMPWLERCLESVRGLETVVVDNGSSDGSVDLVRERFPDARLVEQGNLGLAAGWNRGMREVGGDCVMDEPGSHPRQDDLDDLIHRRLLACRREGAGPDPREVEQVADEPIQPVGLLEDRRQQLPFLFGIVEDRRVQQAGDART